MPALYSTMSGLAGLEAVLQGRAQPGQVLVAPAAAGDGDLMVDAAAGPHVPRPQLTVVHVEDEQVGVPKTQPCPSRCRSPGDTARVT